MLKKFNKDMPPPPRKTKTTIKRKIFNASLKIQNAMLSLISRNDLQVCLMHVPGGKDGRNFDRLHGPYEVRLATLELMSREISLYNIEGATAEVGVFQGDFAKEINKYFPDKKLYLFDTFEGFDERDKNIDVKQNFSDASQDFSDTSVKKVLDKMPHPENCIVKKGWFPDTAKDVEEKFCFVSLDTDLYQPILAGLNFFYPRLVNGGVIMVHDFNNNFYRGVRQAVKEFCVQNNTGYTCLSDLYGSVVITR